jgi:hypothetical protein
MQFLATTSAGNSLSSNTFLFLDDARADLW